MPDFQKEKRELVKRIEEVSKAVIRKDFELLSVKRRLEKRLFESEQARKNADYEKNKTLAIINNFVDGLVVLDQDDKISLINPQARTFLGIRRGRLIGKTIQEASTSPRLRSLASALGKEHKEIFRQELQISEDLVLEISSVFARSDKTILETLIILHDVTREKRIEELKSEFISLAAHQLRTPLSAIKWSLQALLEGDSGKVTKPQYELLEKGYLSNERMIRLVADLLDVVRIEEGRFSYEFVNYPIEKVVDEVFNFFKIFAEKKGIRFILKKPAMSLPKVWIDPDSIRIVLENLFQNAISYTRAGGEVGIKLARTDGEIQIQVKDNGIGIPKNQASRVFSKFFRATDAVRMETEGTGLGLYISKSIIEGHGGRIWFESKKGQGCTFYFTLPIRSNSS